MVSPAERARYPNRMARMRFQEAGDSIDFDQQQDHGQRQDHHACHACADEHRTRSGMHDRDCQRISTIYVSWSGYLKELPASRSPLCQRPGTEYPWNYKKHLQRCAGLSQAYPPPAAPTRSYEKFAGTKNRIRSSRKQRSGRWPDASGSKSGTRPTIMAPQKWPHNTGREKIIRQDRP